MQPKRKIRVERFESHPVEDEGAHLWAISYSDFLMVLLSFFVMFFSISPENRDVLLIKIGSTVGAGTAEAASLSGAGPGAGQGQGGSPAASFKSSALVNQLKSFTLNVQEKDEQLLLQMPQDMFSLNSFKLSPKASDNLNSVFRLLKPYKDEIRITIVGHSDSNPLTKQIYNGWIKDNFSLSVQRALTGLARARAHGFAPDQLAVQGSAEYEVDGRSLTLLIEAKKEKTL